jgi:hypothetical protein
MMRCAAQRTSTRALVPESPSSACVCPRPAPPPSHPPAAESDTVDLRSITFSEHGCWWSLDVVCLDVVCPPPSCPAGPAARAARRSSPPAKARGEASRGAAAAGVVQARAARPRAQESFRERSKAPPILKGYDLFIHWVVMVTLASPRPSAFAVTLISPALGFPAPALPGRTIAVALPR